MHRVASYPTVLLTLTALLAGCGGDPAEPGGPGGPGTPGGGDGESAVSRVPNDMVVARVHDDEITGGQLMDLYMANLGVVAAQLTQGGVKADDPEAVLRGVQGQALETSRFFLVAMHLLAREARATGMVPDEQQLQERFLDRQRKFPSDLEFRNHLAQFGFTPETLRESIATELLAQAYSQSVVGEVTISDAELRAAYEANLEQFRRPNSVWVSHVARIFGINPGEEAKQAERDMIEKAKAELDRGVPFEDVARSYSTAPSASNGGRMYSDSSPPLMEGQMDEKLVPTVIQEVAFRLGEGESSGVLETQDAFHILRVDKRQEAGVAKFDEIKEDLRQMYVERQTRAQTEQEVQRLWQAAEAEGRLELADLAEFLPETPAPTEAPAEG